MLSNKRKYLHCNTGKTHSVLQAYTECCQSFVKLGKWNDQL